MQDFRILDTKAARACWLPLCPNPISFKEVYRPFLRYCCSKNYRHSATCVADVQRSWPEDLKSAVACAAVCLDCPTVKCARRLRQVRLYDGLWIGRRMTQDQNSLLSKLFLSSFPLVWTPWTFILFEKDSVCKNKAHDFLIARVGQCCGHPTLCYETDSQHFSCSSAYKLMWSILNLIGKRKLSRCKKSFPNLSISRKKLSACLSLFCYILSTMASVVFIK